MVPPFRARSQSSEGLTDENRLCRSDVSIRASAHGSLRCEIGNLGYDPCPFDACHPAALSNIADRTRVDTDGLMEIRVGRAHESIDPAAQGSLAAAAVHAIRLCKVIETGLNRRPAPHPMPETFTAPPRRRWSPCPPILPEYL